LIIAIWIEYIIMHVGIW